MTALHSRRRRRDSDTSNNSDAENDDPQRASGSSEPSKKRVKRGPSIAELKSDIGDMKDILASSVKDQQKYHADIVHQENLNLLELLSMLDTA